MSTRLTVKRLEAMRGAVLAMLAGEIGEGDWPTDVAEADMRASLEWINAQLQKRAAK